MLAKATTARGGSLSRCLCRAMGDANSAHEFDMDTALRPNSGDASLCRLREPLSAAWSVIGAPNGGLLAAIGISAMRFHPEQPFRDPLTLTSHFLAPAVEGAGLEARAAVLKRGKNTATSTALLTQHGRARVHHIATFGDLAVQHGLTGDTVGDGAALSAGTPPQTSLALPPECIRGNPMLRADLPVSERAELLVAPNSDWARGYAIAHASEELAPAFEGWLRLTDGRLPCLRSLSLYVDVTPPPILNVLGLGVRWLPTLEMTTHFRARPRVDPDGWVAVRARSHALRDGLFETNAEVWDTTPPEEGGPKLCATARQLAKVIMT